MIRKIYKTELDMMQQKYFLFNINLKENIYGSMKNAE